MSAEALLAELQRMDVRVRAVDGRLRVNAPKDALTPELQAQLSAAKPELLRLLTAPASDPALNRGLAVREVLTFPAGLLALLDVPTTLVLDVRGVDGPITVGTHAGCTSATFGPGEWRTLISAAHSERAWPAQMLAWCERKRRDPRWRLTEDEATGSVVELEAQQWTVSRTLKRLGAKLRAVVVEGGAAC